MYQYLEEVVAISERVDDMHHTQSIRYLLVGARIYFNNSDFERAAPLYKRAIELASGSIAASDEIAHAMSNLAFCYLALKTKHKFTETLSLLAQAVNLLVDSFGDLHLSLIPSLLRYARLFETNGRYNQV